ncbi:MAG: virulence factor TspB C-terminal domain-related protein [Sedimenticola sp.]
MKKLLAILLIFIASSVSAEFAVWHELNNAKYPPNSESANTYCATLGREYSHNAGEHWANDPNGWTNSKFICVWPQTTSGIWINWDAHFLECTGGQVPSTDGTECIDPVDCAQNTTTEYYTGTGAAPASVCDGGCQYINGAAHSTGGNWGGWYTGSGLNCQAGDGTGAATDPAPNAGCTDPEFPLAIDGAPGICLPAPDSPLTDDHCFSFNGERVCDSDGDTGCSHWEKLGQVCPDYAQNCVWKGGRLVCPSQPPPEGQPPEEGATCVTIGGKQVCFKDGKYQETTDTSATNNPDGSTTTTETSSSNVAGTGSTTTTTVVNPDGSSTTTTEKEPTSTDQDADGTPDEAGKGSASGGTDCTAPPTCEGDPIACAQLRQQWEQRCEAKKLNDALGVGEEVDQTLFDYQGTTGEALSEHGLLSEETGLFDDVRATVDGGSFGACPADMTINTSLVGTITLSSQPLCDFIDMIRPFILSINALFVIMWFVRVAF